MEFLGEVFKAAGSMSREAMLQLKGEPLVRKYVDRNGVKRCVGLKDKLKASQILSHINLVRS